MKNLTFWRTLLAFLISIPLVSCEEFVELETPNHKITSQDVFKSDETAISAMTGIYNQLALASFSNGSSSSVTFLSGLSADNLKNISTTNLSRTEFEQNQITPDNTLNLSLWSSAYNIIYLTNALLEGIEGSDSVSEEVRSHLEGEAKFVRAFTYFYLVNLYGDVPLILNTDFRENEVASRNSEEEVYQQILSDLQMAISSLEDEYVNGERTRINKYAAKALLARVHLYLGEWQLAEDLSSQVIAQSGTYEILENYDTVFLANSKEAIWQISPNGRGNVSTHTNEGNIFIIHPVFSFFASVKLNEALIQTFDQEDQRLVNWVGYNAYMDAHYPFKYKIWNSSEQPILEYSMVLRLSEQYLIRSEARVAQGKYVEAIQDMNILRERAGIEPIPETDHELGEADLSKLLLEERRRELFTEWGHRWLDLKRTGKAGEILGSSNPSWQSTDVLYPIPGEERKKNNQLTQNLGY